MRAIRVALLVLIGGAAYIHAPVETRDGLPVPDIPGYRTLKGDFHLHGVASKGASVAAGQERRQFW
jgi:hypothetical protein